MIGSERQRFSEKRFAFGRNWRDFLGSIDEDRIAAAASSLQAMLGVPNLEGKRVLDVGCGSGLFSLAARRLGAKVHSFDYDPESVRCTEVLKGRYCPDDELWTIEQGDVLDESYLSRLGEFDIVYSWGVLHHTGQMWRALENAEIPIRSRGSLYIAIYNDQGWISKYWLFIKRAYNRSAALRVIITVGLSPYLFGLRYIMRALTGRLRSYRGMSLWYDMKDWLGGYPFEVAKPEEILDFYRQRGFVLAKLKTSGGRHGCNEYVLIREA